MKNSLIIFVSLFVFLTSCTDDSSGLGMEKPHYAFTAEDKLKLIKPEIIGSSLKYKNQNNVIREFVVKKCSIGRGGQSDISVFSTDYTYELQETELEFKDENGFIIVRIYFQRKPHSSDYSTLPPKFSNVKFTGYIDFSISNYGCTDLNYASSCNLCLFDSANTIPSMIIDGKEYKDVLVFNSYNTNVYPSEYDSSAYQKTINRIYYSYDYSIIGYDDVDGTMWRIVN